jgi:hypothetical protein
VLLAVIAGQPEAMLRDPSGDARLVGVEHRQCGLDRFACRSGTGKARGSAIWEIEVVENITEDLKF